MPMTGPTVCTSKAPFQGRSTPPAPRCFPQLPGMDLWRGQRIGLLGGSFNPAHEGHLHISLEAIKRLNLDHVWWLVSPQNPLKSSKDMAPLQDRLRYARSLVRHPRIHVSDIEQRLGTTYTANTLERLKSLLPHSRLIWLMGADNLQQFPNWKRWTDIVATVPLAVFDRNHYSLRGLTGKMATRFRHSRLSVQAAKALATKTAPAWVFISLRRHPASATEIREAQTAISPFSVAVKPKE